MRTFFYRACLVALVAWTMLSVGACVLGMGAAGIFLESVDPEYRTAAEWGATIGLVFNLMMWGIVVVPLGIIALVIKPDRKQEHIVYHRYDDSRLPPERIEPTLTRRDPPLIEARPEDRITRH
jgi:hypothetical protein